MDMGENDKLDIEWNWRIDLNSRRRNYGFFGVVVAVFFGVMCSASSFASDSLPATIERIKPGIVVVGTFQRTRSPRGLFLGTGFAIGDGSLVVTNAHVVAKQLDEGHLESLAVFIRRGGKDQMVQARQVATDPEHDLAILKLSGNARLPPMRLGDSSKVKEGELYAFTGYPIGMVLGLFPVTHRGIVSAITPMAIPVIQSRQLNTKMLKRLRNPYDVFQLDATAYPGNSGSPLYDPESGEVVGIINKVFVKESKEQVLSQPSGITYAIPVVYLRQLMGKVKGER